MLFMAGDADKTGKEEIVLETKNFFDSYKKEIGDSLRKGNNVIYLDFAKLSEFSSTLSDALLSSPEEISGWMEHAIEESGLVSNARW